MASKLYIQSDTYIKPRTNENTGYIAQAVNIEGINPDTGETQSIQAILQHLYSLIGGSTPVVQYTVKFMNGSTVVSEVTGPTGTAVTRPSNPSKSGYNFVGWNTNQNATTAGTVITSIGTSNVTYYAIWSEIPVAQYTVKFMNGSTVVSEVTGPTGTAVTRPSNPSKTGYNFVGWNTNSSATTAGTVITSIGTSNVTYYAIWSIKIYTVTLTVNGGSGGPTSKTVNHGGTVTFTGVSPDSEHTDINATVSEGATISGTTITLTNVTSNKDIIVTFPEVQHAIYYQGLANEDQIQSQSYINSLNYNENTKPTSTVSLQAGYNLFIFPSDWGTPVLYEDDAHTFRWTPYTSSDLGITDPNNSRVLVWEAPNNTIMYIVW